MTHDGIGKYLSGIVDMVPGPTDNIVQIVKDTGQMW